MVEASEPKSATEAVLRVLGQPNRIRLLQLLRSPRTLEELRLPPAAGRGGGSAGRPISRQAVQKHLAQLERVGLVRSRAKRVPGHPPMKEYQLDHARLFAAIDELHTYAVPPPGGSFDPTETIARPRDEVVRWEPGPKLVLVYGVQEGRVFPLRATELRGPRGWVLGRGPNAHVALRHDPYVSNEHSEIVRSEGGFRVIDLRSAKNRTSVNWTPLALGGEADLRNGDVIGVGRSLLLFRTE